MCYSFNSAENRAAFTRDEDAYCRQYGLNDEQRSAIANRNVLALIAASEQSHAAYLRIVERA